MFFEPERIKAVREMIVSDRLSSKAALAKILTMQRGDFEAIYRAMGLGKLSVCSIPAA